MVRGTTSSNTTDTITVHTPFHHHHESSTVRLVVYDNSNLPLPGRRRVASHTLDVVARNGAFAVGTPRWHATLCQDAHGQNRLD